MTAGHPPLGAFWDGPQVVFTAFSAHAHRLELCLFDDAGRETHRHPLTLMDADRHLWRVVVPQLPSGQRYGYRAHGPFAPEQGHWFNPQQLLLDPYARAIDTAVRWHPSHFSQAAAADATSDSAPFTPKSVVIDDAFDWEDDQPPRTPWRDSAIYEVHLGGFTRQHPQVPPALQGTCAGFAQPAVIDHLKQLGVTAVEFLPLQYFVDEPFLQQRGLVNYWGYSPVNLFAIHPRYLHQNHPNEFKQLVKTLHRAGLEVIVDVVFNHTGEGGERGPTLSFRGIDNATYYRRHPTTSGGYEDFSGCGNALDLRQPAVLQLVLDSLRYWVGTLHVDGFRFDLTPALGRHAGAFDAHAPLFMAIYQDPLLRHCKLIAEPWDLGADGYCLGRFAPPWREWNGRFRDDLRDFWRGEPHKLGDLARRLTGSADLFHHQPHATASINFVTAHDGFTLHDLVSYEAKHNEANGEANRDGESHNRSQNHGHEGPTDRPVIQHRRQRQQRNFLATLLLAQGVPLLLFGDEIGRSQQGNNNTYCQDNPMGWMPWSWEPSQRALLKFTHHLLHLRRQHTAFRQPQFFSGQKNALGIKDLDWLSPTGDAMTPDRWDAADNRAVGLLLSGRALAHAEAVADRETDWLWLLNGGDREMAFVLPAPHGWRRVLDTDRGYTVDADGHAAIDAITYPLAEKSVVLLRRAAAKTAADEC